MILNLTQHPGTPEQGVTEPWNKKEIQDLLTFEEVPTFELLCERADKLATVAATAGAEKVMIGGAPFFMGYLVAELRIRGIEPLYAFSKRVVIETVATDGKVSKTAVFKHVGWVPA